MKRQRHRHKDSFSILLISHMGQSGRQFHISELTFRLLLFMLFLICALVLGLIWQIPAGRRQRQLLEAHLAEKEQMIAVLESEKETLTAENQALARENEFLMLVGKSGEEEKVSGLTEDKEESQSDPAFPGLSPSSEMGMLLSAYTEDEPYISLNTHVDDRLIAAGNGTITAVSSDDTYPLIIELEHENGYQTRYMCRQMAELQLEENTQVKAGDILAVITSDNTQLDYQVIFEGEPIDPLNVIDAKG